MKFGSAYYEYYQKNGLSKSVKALSPYLICKFNEGIVETINRKYNHHISGENFNTNGNNIIDEDWDNLIILDACRYDSFAELNNFDQNLEYKVSLGSKTWEFVRGNFKNKKLLDTVYITSNPWFERLKKELNAEVYYYYLAKRDGFNGATTHPKTFTDKTIEMAEEYPNKKLIIHYLQPHDPYYDEQGNELFKLPSTCPIYNKFQGYSQEEIVDAYNKNLTLVLHEVERLLPHLDGKTVITADHGELLGERMHPIPLRKYEHPEGIYVDELVKVPWLVIDSQHRKKIIEADESIGTEIEDDISIQKQLESLGYV